METIIIEQAMISLHELPAAFENALSHYTEKYGDCWGGGVIKLVEVRFESNFRRRSFIAVFEVGCASN